MKVMYSLFIALLLISCADQSDEPQTLLQNRNFADIVKVEVAGKEDSYSFSVTISSSDTGCEQYADWWELITEDGKLLYRRILAHSHVSEQPFTRSGGTVEISKNRTVYVRAHMNNSGYGGTVMKGSISKSFAVAEIAPDFAKDLEAQEPLPKDCAF